MIFRKISLYSLAVLIVLSSVLACSPAKEIEERKNLMMPKKSEMMRNSRYREVEKRKVNKQKPSKKKRKSLN
jgi:hypothetical protein